MSCGTEICCRTTAIGSVWAVSSESLNLGDLRRFIDAAAELSDATPVSVCSVDTHGEDGKYYFRRIDAHAATTIANKIVDVEITAENTATVKDTATVEGTAT